MSLRVSFELDESDLEHFRLIMREARKVAVQMPPEDVVASAERILAEIGVKDTPGFIQERIGKLRLLIRMLSDIDWRLPHEEAKRVLNALAYFTEPDDLIPDHIPGLGYLDDAIMVELVMRELRHEIEAYEDFCDYRDRNGTTSREDWLARRREKLQARMRRRRKASRRKLDEEKKPGLFD
ncbi:MAG: DUF1232 domain-containing protein [Woeseiaceae bacterium]|nr:DUF1232 domain-containing protein [Woeseiaceae bacterium]NIP20179.1 DUF1232 domain-containing protein [Woeseiaceae bacterium]NIS88975.1 DUF1232 domain-containing protein [Woeseiaceae bacterium]